MRTVLHREVRARFNCGLVEPAEGEHAAIVDALEAAGHRPVCDSADGIVRADVDVAIVACRLSPFARPLTLEAVAAELPVVVVTPATEAHAVRRAMAAGAKGVVSSADVDRALVATIGAVLAGQRCTPDRADAGRSHLSYREKQVLRLVAKGLTNAEIGAQLYLAPSTVKSHLATAFRKLGVRSRFEAAALVLEPDQFREFELEDDVDLALAELARA